MNKVHFPDSKTPKTKKFSPNNGTNGKISQDNGSNEAEIEKGIFDH